MGRALPKDLPPGLCACSPEDVAPRPGLLHPHVPVGPGAPRLAPVPGEAPFLGSGLALLQAPGSRGLLCIEMGRTLPPRLPLGRSDSARLPAGLLVAPAGVAAQPVALLGWARGRESLGKPPRPRRPRRRLQLARSRPSEARQPQLSHGPACGGGVGARCGSTPLPEKGHRWGRSEQGQRLRAPHPLALGGGPAS